MQMVGGSGVRTQMMQQQADAVISQANPVSTTLYEVLATTKNVRVIALFIQITWATTQPTPLEIIVTIDGNTITGSLANPVSGANYYAYLSPTAATLNVTTTLGEGIYRAFQFEGRSVKVEARITWAVTQPTPLECRVKYAKIP